MNRLWGMALAALVLPATAQAKDKDVVQAYVKFRPAVEAASDLYRKGAQLTHDQPTSRRGYKLCVRADNKLNRLTRKRIRAIKAARPSTDDGRAGKDALLTSLRTYIKANEIEISAVDALFAGRRGRFRGLLRKCDRVYDRAVASYKQAEKAFKRAGAPIPDNPGAAA